MTNYLKFCAILIACILTLVIGVNPLIASAKVNNNELSFINDIEFTEEFNELDLVTSTAIFVKRQFGNNYPYPISITPLYNTNDEIVAYYVFLSNNYYLIINANRQNPIVTEFGENENYLLKANKILEKDSENKNYYLSPGVIAKKDSNREIYTFLESPTATKELSKNDLKENPFITFCQEPNVIESDKLIQYKDTIANRKGVNEERNIYEIYYFLLYTIPSETWISEKYLDIGYTPAEYLDFYGLGANNYCASVSAYNLLAYYRYKMGNPIAESEGDKPVRDYIFIMIWRELGNGPVTPLAYRNGITRYIGSETQYSITTSNPANTWANYKAFIDQEKMPFMCVWPLLFDAHMINGIGYVESESSKYARIIDNWDCFCRWYIFGEALYNLSYVYIYEG